MFSYNDLFSIHENFEMTILKYILVMSSKLIGSKYKGECHTLRGKS